MELWRFFRDRLVGNTQKPDKNREEEELPITPELVERAGITATLPLLERNEAPPTDGWLVRFTVELLKIVTDRRTR